MKNKSTNFTYSTQNMVGDMGLEPTHLAVGVFETPSATYYDNPPYGGPYRTRTGHLKLARLALSQMS